MSSTFSPNLAIELIGTFDQAGSWGNTTNTNLGTLIEQAISGYVTQAVATGTDTTITIPNGATGVARNMYLELTGTGGASTNLIVPANKKLYFIFNNTSSGQVTVKVAGQTGISVPNGKKMILVSNGTDIVTAENYVASLSSDNLTLTGTLAVGSTSTFTGAATFSAGTANQVQYLNASKVLTGSANLTFDGTTLTANALTLTNNPTLSAGTANGVLYLNGSKVATSGSALTFDGTNLGVGAASRPSRLTLEGTNGAVGSQIQLVGTGILSGYIGPSADGLNFGTDSGGLLFRTGVTGNGSVTTGTERMRLTSSVLSTDSSINVGIGTASPAATLQLKASSGNTGLYIQDASGSPSVSFLDSAGTVQWQLYSTMGGAAGLDPLSLYNSSAGVVATFSNSGNLGLGVTPSTWSVGKAFEIGHAGNAIFDVAATQLTITQNAYYNAAYKYGTTAAATRYDQAAGQHIWYTAPSGTAGNAISFGDAKMTLDASGNLGVGTTSPGNRLDVVTSSASGVVARLRNSASNGYSGIHFSDNAGTSSAHIGWGNSGVASPLTSAGYFGTIANAPVVFTTNDTERGRFTADGNFLVGTTTFGTTFGATAGVIKQTGGVWTDRGQVTVGGGTTTTLVTLANASNNQTYLLSARQSGSQSNYVLAFVTAYGANSSASRIVQDNTTGGTTDMNITVSGLSLQLVLGSGFGNTTWDWVLTRVG